MKNIFINNTCVKPRSTRFQDVQNFLKKYTMLQLDDIVEYNCN